MTPATPPVLYISADTSDLTTRYIASPDMHPGAEVWVPRPEWRSIAKDPPPGGLPILAYDGGCLFRSERIEAGHPDDEDYYTCESGQPCVYRPEPQWWMPLVALPAPDEGEQDEGEG